MRTVSSARSAGVLDLHAALNACGEHLVAHGGHAAAAGLKLEEDSLEAFRADFCEYAAEEISESDRVAEVHIDAEAPLSVPNGGDPDAVVFHPPDPAACLAAADGTGDADGKLAFF